MTCYTWRFSSAHRIQQFFIFMGFFSTYFCFVLLWLLNYPFLVILQHLVGPMKNNHEKKITPRLSLIKKHSLLHFPFSYLLGIIWVFLIILSICHFLNLPLALLSSVVYPHPNPPLCQPVHCFCFCPAGQTVPAPLLFIPVPFPSLSSALHMD